MKRIIISALIVVATVLGVAVIDQTLHPAEARDCSANAVAKCGVWSVSEMRNAYDKDTTKGLRNIFNGMGISTDTMHNATVKEGYVHKAGHITVGNETVATGAISAGRTIINNKRTKKSYNGTVYYTSAVPDTFRSSKLASYIFLDKDGRFLGAVVKDCGNPVKGVPVPPKPTPPKPSPAVSCDLLKAGTPNNVMYNFAVTATASNGAQITGYTFNMGDGTVKKQTSNIAGHTYTKPGTYTVTVTVHSSVGDITSEKCKTTVTVPEQPAAVCTDLKAVVTKRTNVTLTGRASAKNGATINGYVFAITGANGEVYNKTVTTNAATASATAEVKEAGTYTAKLTVRTSVGDKTAPACETTFTIDREKTPGVSIDKKVDGQEHKDVAVGETFTYQLAITNKGEVDLDNVKVTDDAPAHVQFISADKGTITDNKWSYTIPRLKIGETVNVAITAKVTKEVTDTIKNTACVDAPAVPGNPDDCDDATVKVPPTPETPTIEVCDLTSKKFIKIKKDEFDSSKHSTNPKDCEVTPPAPNTPQELPTTGLEGTLFNLLGLGTLVGTTIAYALSRRNIG